MTEASVIVDSVRDDALAVAVAGEIDMSNAPTVERQILEAIPNHLAAVTVDLSALDYIDSAGLRLLFTLGTRLETLQIGLVLVVISEFVGTGDGLGSYIWALRGQFLYPEMYAAILFLGLLGYALNQLFLVAERRILAWHYGAAGESAR